MFETGVTVNSGPWLTDQLPLHYWPIDVTVKRPAKKITRTNTFALKADYKWALTTATRWQRMLFSEV